MCKLLVCILVKIRNFDKFKHVFSLQQMAWLLNVNSCYARQTVK